MVSVKEMKEKCRGCNNACERIQEHNWEDDGVTRLKVPTKSMEPFCREFELHLTSVVQLHEIRDLTATQECPRFWNT